MEVIESEDFFARLHLPSETIPQFKEIRYNEPPKKNFELDKTPVELIIGYGNLVSDEVKRRLAPGEPRRVFRDTGNLAPADHPTGTRLKPDITVVSEGRKIPLKEAPNWPDIESLSEVHSKGISQPNSVDQAYAYTAFLLQARPDRVAILTFWAGKAGMCFIIADALGYQRTPVLAWRGEEGRLRHRLFCAFVYRLYLPHSSMVDPSIERHGLMTIGKGLNEKRYYLFYVDWKQDKPPSDGAKPKKRRKNAPTYYIKHVGHPVGRRSIVFRNFRKPITVNGMQVDIIKEQYISSQPEHRFQETDIIKHIHKDGLVPGVVRMLRYEEVEYEDGEIIELERSGGCSAMEKRIKVRIAECDMGESFVELKTPREMLIAAHDTLAITRYLFLKRGVLHRDISKGNVRCISDSEKRKRSSQSDDATKKPSIPASDLCCAEYLLRENKEDWTALMATLIDYDHGEILNENVDKPHAERTGTAVYISRAVLKGCPIPISAGIRSFSYPEMPDAPDQRYRDTYPDRMIKFPTPASLSTYVNTVNVTALQKQGSWRHELRHDAESIFWLMFYWIILAWPEDGEEVMIPGDEWGHLTVSDDEKDYRDVIFHRLKIPKGVVHTDYKELEPLVMELWSHIQYDHHFAPSGPLRDPEYVHEAFQRCILSFLIKHGESDFMTKKKRDIHRETHSFTISATEKSGTAITNIRRSSTHGAEANTAPIPPYRFEPKRRTAIGSPPAAYSDFLAPSVCSSSESSSSHFHSQPSRTPSPEQNVAKKTKSAPAPARRRSSRPNPPKEGSSSLIEKARKKGKTVGKMVDKTKPAGLNTQTAKHKKSAKEPSSAPSQVSQPSSSQLTPPDPPRRSTRLLKRDAPHDLSEEQRAQPPKKQRRQPKGK